MNHGISVYPGLDNTLEENVNLMETAAKFNIGRIFTSFNIPETNKDNFKKELDVILKTAKKYDMEIISDVSPATQKLLDIDATNLKDLRKMGITTIRLDDGYSAEEIAKLSRNPEGVRLQLNASAIGENFLENLAKNNADFSNTEALHNFYPRKNTGLSEEFFVSKNNLLKKYNVKTAAFISSEGKRRCPIFEGLPTLEAHRNLDASLAARHLAALGTDGVFISESLPLAKELETLSKIRSGEVKLKIKLSTENSDVKKLLSNTFTARADEARDVIRAKNSRLLAKFQIEPENAAEREIGFVTLDNCLYKRYMGELQIVRQNLPKDERVNVVAKILQSEIFMLKYILPEKNFSFVFNT